MTFVRYKYDLYTEVPIHFKLSFSARLRFFQEFFLNNVTSNEKAIEVTHIKNFRCQKTK